MRKIYGSFVVVFVATFLCSCAYRLGDFTVASTKNVELGQTYKQIGSQVKGVNKVPIIIFVPLGEPNLEEAIDTALNKVGGELMTNVVIYYKYFWIPYIYGEFSYEVTGDVWKKTGQSIGRIDKNKLDNAEKIFKAVKENGEIKLVEITKDEI